MCNSGTVQVLHNLTGLPHDAPERAPPPALDATDHDADRDEHEQAPGDARDEVKIRLAAAVFVRGAARVLAVAVVEGVGGDDPVAPALPGLAPPDGAAASEQLVLTDFACVHGKDEAGAEQRIHAVCNALRSRAALFTRRLASGLPCSLLVHSFVCLWLQKVLLQPVAGLSQSTYVAWRPMPMRFTGLRAE